MFHMCIGGFTLRNFFFNFITVCYNVPYTSSNELVLLHRVETQPKRLKRSGKISLVCCCKKMLELTPLTQNQYCAYTQWILLPIEKPHRNCYLVLSNLDSELTPQHVSRRDFTTRESTRRTKYTFTIQSFSL